MYIMLAQMVYIYIHIIGLTIDCFAGVYTIIWNALCCQAQSLEWLRDVDAAEVTVAHKPQNGWFMMKHPMKMDDLEVPPFLETSICSHPMLMRFMFISFHFIIRVRRWCQLQHLQNVQAPTGNRLAQLVREAALWLGAKWVLLEGGFSPPPNHGWFLVIFIVDPAVVT